MWYEFIDFGSGGHSSIYVCADSTQSKNTKKRNNQETGCFISPSNRLTFRMGYLKYLSFEIIFKSRKFI